jgi:hypothetical protein
VFWSTLAYPQIPFYAGSAQEESADVSPCLAAAYVAGQFKKRGAAEMAPLGWSKYSFRPQALEAEMQRQLGESRASNGVLDRATVAAGRNQVSG